ncbi:MAG: hypothetical protein HC901_03055 [Bdellovibrionaceae bacterium]|nr:hypothetical protein [Pseudobdellovibrionaceae bacterium]
MGEAKKKRRECPAVGRAITGQECGQNRGNQYACPGDCPHWPFSVQSYDAFLEIEGKFDDQLTGACLRLRGPDVFGPKSMGQPADELEFNALMCWKMFYERDGGGRTLIEQWEAEGWPGLSNDGRYLMRHHRGIRPGILEVRRRLGEGITEVVEVLRSGVSEPFLLCDYGMARHARRFGCFLGWFYRMPSFGRFKGAAMDITAVGDWDAGEALERLAEINGAPAGGGEEWHIWLARYFCEISGLLQTHQRQAHQVTLASMDARQVRRRYRIVSGRKVLVEDLGAQLAGRGDRSGGIGAGGFGGPCLGGARGGTGGRRAAAQGKP